MSRKRKKNNQALKAVVKSRQREFDRQMLEVQTNLEARYSATKAEKNKDIEACKSLTVVEEAMVKTGLTTGVLGHALKMVMESDIKNEFPEIVARREGLEAKHKSIMGGYITNFRIREFRRSHVLNFVENHVDIVFHEDKSPFDIIIYEDSWNLLEGESYIYGIAEERDLVMNMIKSIPEMFNSYRYQFTFYLDGDDTHNVALVKEHMKFALEDLMQGLMHIEDDVPDHILKDFIAGRHELPERISEFRKQKLNEVRLNDQLSDEFKLRYFYKVICMTGFFKDYHISDSVEESDENDIVVSDKLTND